MSGSRLFAATIGGCPGLILTAVLGVSADAILGIKPLKKAKSKQPDTRLQRRLQRIEKLNPKAKRQITQLLDTFIEREELKQRVEAQES